MPKTLRKAISQHQLASTPVAPAQQKRLATLEEIHLRKTALYFTIVHAQKL